MDNTDLAIRMKEYERVNKRYLQKRTPVIVRVDGVAFSTFTKGMRRPFDDEILLEAMRRTMLAMCKWIPGCVFGYTQSDEITFVITDYKTFNTGAFYDYVSDKLVSIIASRTSVIFNQEFKKRVEIVFKDVDTDEARLYRTKVGEAFFDGRAFSLSKEEVQNNLYWRQFDASKNSVAQVAQYYFTQKELYKKSTSQQQDMLMTQKNINWNNYPTRLKRGTCCIRKRVEIDVTGKRAEETTSETFAPDADATKSTENAEVKETKKKVTYPWILDRECPIFTKDWNYITDRVYYQGDFANMK